MKKYIQDSLILTKEGMEEYIQKQRQAQAEQFGLTLEQYQEALLNNSVVQSKSPTDISPNKQQ